MALRFVRRSPFSIDDDLNSPVLSDHVNWLEKFCESKFFQLPSSFSLHAENLYKQGHIVGMDAASVASVWALQLEPHLSCIDTCCAPGMKFSLIGDYCVDVTGLDVSEHRLDVCHTLLGKYGYSSLQERTFLVSPNWCVGGEGISTQFLQVRASRKRKKKGKKRPRTGQEVSDPLLRQYDRVLVDAECTHDGSARHTSKHSSESTEFVDDSAPMSGFWTRQSDKSRVQYDSEEKIAALVEKQKVLILNGFRLLKPGGLMVYSTCSLQSIQNEDVVKHLLETEQDAVVGTLPFGKEVPAKFLSEGMCLFDPATSGTSGQFIAVIRRS